MAIFDYFGGLCIVIVIVQLLRIVLPWIYENFLGPCVFGCRVKLSAMGEWAGHLYSPKGTSYIRCYYS
uniref:Uncharacterized protein n=1 Tax=Phlebotomus papatasi TaxID=29031 RepID=A0A1B0F0C3_PHLPP